MGSFEILQVPNKVLGGFEILTFRLVCVIPEDDDLVNLENGANSGDLTNEVSSEVRVLWDFEDGFRKANG